MIQPPPLLLMLLELEAASRQARCDLAATTSESGFRAARAQMIPAMFTVVFNLRFVDCFTVRRYGRTAVHRASWWRCWRPAGLLTQRHLPHYGTASKARVKGRWASTLHAGSSERTDVGRGRRQARASPLFGSPSLSRTRVGTTTESSVRPHAVNWFFKRAGHRATYPALHVPLAGQAGA